MDYTARISALEKEILNQERKLHELREELQHALRQNKQTQTHSSLPLNDPSDLIDSHADDVLDGWLGNTLSAISTKQPQPRRWPLRPDEYKRYGRQLIMTEVGLQGQLRLKSTSILVVGVGGLGCPAAAYLAGAGIGTLGLVDGDTVEESNLHRQILHSTDRLGMGKAESAIKALRWYVKPEVLESGVIVASLNPNVNYIPHSSRLTPNKAVELFKSYDVVLDCTDSPASRYLISDACVILGKPLVSASALRTEGQLMVLNFPSRPPGDANGGPCYRCIFPKPPPADSVVSCSDGGILGPVVGVMGVLQALEAFKMIASGRAKISGPADPPIRNGDAGEATDTPSLLMFSAYSSPQFRTIRLRGRKPNCAACSLQATITHEILASGSMDYVQFCGSISPISLLTPEERVSATTFAEMQSVSSKSSGAAPVVIDVREKVQFELCKLEGSHNVPFSRLSALTVASGTSGDPARQTIFQELQSLLESSSTRNICLVCRQGNDSQVAVRQLKSLGLDDGGRRWIGDMKGGLAAWKQEVDPDFPEY